VVPAAGLPRSHAGKPLAARVLFRSRVDYELASTTVGHGMHRQGWFARHGSRGTKSTRNHRGARLPAFLRSACSQVGWRPAPRPRLTTSLC